MTTASIPTRLAQHLARWFFAPQSPKILAAWRITTNAWTLYYLAKRWKLIGRTASGDPRNFRPIGLARPLRRPLPPKAIEATTTLNYATTTLAGLGAWYRVTGPLNSLITLWTLTYRNSWSMVFHNDNTAVLHHAVLGASPAADAWSLDAIRSPHGVTGPEPSWRHGWPLHAANALTAATYFVSGVAKLRGPLGWRWANGEHLRSQVAVDGIRKTALRPHDTGPPRPLIALLDRHRWSWTAFATGSLALELLAPLALVDRRIGRLWSISAWSMHIGIKAVMNITFRYHLSANPYLPFLARTRT